MIRISLADLADTHVTIPFATTAARQQVAMDFDPPVIGQEPIPIPVDPPSPPPAAASSEATTDGANDGEVSP